MVFCRALVVAGLVCGGLGVAATRAGAQRLPTGVRPEHYSLLLTPDLRSATFKGVETIDVTLDAATSAITLNAAEIEFASVKAYTRPAGLIVDYSPGKKVKNTAGPIVDLTKFDENPQAATVALDPVKEQATFTFAHPLDAGPVTLEIEYSGLLNDKLRGFYLSKTKSRSYAVTQFEATDARRAFPSFDEPALKATFDVTLVVDAADTAISNTKIVSDRPGPVAGKHTIVFGTTPKMSTYLVAFLVGDFVCTEGKSDGVPIRACSTPDKVGLTRFALETAKWSLHYYDRYFGIKYPMAKLDLIAIPDFEAGAMENFGCLTFRETEMLVDEKDGAIAAKKEVVETVAHELSHQWFGDMVTMQWWDNLWLNEGFATWMESKAAARWHPEWKYDQDVAVSLDQTLDADAQPTTRAIRTKAETPAEINEMFDDIAYGKAGAVIGMVENWVGEEVFRKGVHEYLAAHLYANATAEDFWGTQTRVSGLPVDAVMRSFVEQPGVPVVVFGQRAGSLAAAAQHRLASGTETGLAWTIPVCVRVSGCKVLTPEAKQLEVAREPALLFANAADKGYYRTSYSSADSTHLVARAEGDLTAPERIGLLGDRWALMRAGQGTVGDFLDLALAVKNDPNNPVVDSALGKIGQVGKLIATDEDRQRLNAVVRQQFGPVYAAMGKAAKHEPFEAAELRGTLFQALGDAQDQTVLDEANSVTKQLFDGHKPPDATIVDAAVALASAKGDAAMYDKMLRVERNATDPDLKTDALHLLTRFQSPVLVARTLLYAVSDEVRSQDSWTLIALLLDRRETQDQAWEFVETHWVDIAKKSTVNSGARIVEAAGAFCSVERRDEVARFFAMHPVESSERTLAKTLDGIDACIRLRAAHEPELRQWLEEHGAAAGGS